MTLGTILLWFSAGMLIAGVVMFPLSRWKPGLFTDHGVQYSQRQADLIAIIIGVFGLIGVIACS